MAVPWWQEGVLYQIYPRSFADSDGDGVGDLRGILGKLDHLEWLGVDGLWLNPTMPSPNVDWGYDVADYLGVHPDLGTMEDLDELVAAAARRGIRILLDLVPNHTSDRHDWFLDSRASRDAAHRNWYVWADAKPDGSPPNNWTSAFGGPAWTWDEATQQFFMHNFALNQPDLNWWSEDVRGAFEEILRFWFERGVAGFRIDVANALVTDRDLRDNPPPSEDDDPWSRRRGQKAVYNANRPEVHEIYRRWRRIANGYDPERLLVGEAWAWDLPEWFAYYGDGDELQLLFNFRLLDAGFEARALRELFERIDAAAPAGRPPPALVGSNHDVVRFPTRWCEGDPRRVRCALLALLGLPGTPFLYYGDEIGMTSADVPPERELDVASPSRDPARTPMQWADEPGGGFTAPGVEPWLPFGDVAACNVAAQRDDPLSVLRFCRDAIALRRGRPELRGSGYASLPTGEGVWAWRRGADTVVALNLSDGDAQLDVAGAVLLATDRKGEWEPFGGRLGPWTGVVLSTRDSG